MVFSWRGSGLNKPELRPSKYALIGPSVMRSESWIMLPSACDAAFPADCGSVQVHNIVRPTKKERIAGTETLESPVLLVLLIQITLCSSSGSVQEMLSLPDESR